MAKYVDKQEFTSWFTDVDGNRERIGRVLLLICEGAASRYWAGAGLDDAVSAMLLACWTKIGKFDPSFVDPKGRRANAFSYYTTVAINAMRAHGRVQTSWRRNNGAWPRSADGELMDEGLLATLPIETR